MLDFLNIVSDSKMKKMISLILFMNLGNILIVVLLKKFLYSSFNNG
jgi:hypothetical protein